MVPAACERCGVLIGGGQATTVTMAGTAGAGNRLDLCETCYRALERWACSGTAQPALPIRWLHWVRPAPTA